MHNILNARIRNLDALLRAAVAAEDTTSDIVDITLATWNNLAAVVSGWLPVPDAAVGADGQILLSWDRDRRHFMVGFQ